MSLNSSALIAHLKGLKLGLDVLILYLEFLNVFISKKPSFYTLGCQFLMRGSLGLPQAACYMNGHLVMIYIRRRFCFNIGPWHLCRFSALKAGKRMSLSCVRFTLLVFTSSLFKLLYVLLLRLDIKTRLWKSFYYNLS